MKTLSRPLFLAAFSLSATAVAADPAAGKATPKKTGGFAYTASKLRHFMPTRSLPTGEDLARDFTTHQVALSGDTALCFDITLPRTWESRPVEVKPEQKAEDEKALVPVALFAPTEGAAGAEIEVRYQRVPEKTDVEKWLRDYVLKSAGAQLLGLQKGEYNGRRVFEALLKSKSKEGVSLTRLAASRKEGRMFVVSARAPDNVWDAVKEAFAVAVVGFNPDAKPPEPKPPAPPEAPPPVVPLPSPVTVDPAESKP